jgi:hypothetical protein
MKINKSLYLLILIIEECAEVIQEVCKAIRFGLDEVRPSQELTNGQRINYEINDLACVIDLAAKEKIINQTIYFDMRARKEEKVRKYMNYSRDIGVLEK